MSRETKVPAIPAVGQDNVTDVVRAIKSALDVREGRLGDPLDQFVTLRELKAMGLVAEDQAGTDMTSVGGTGSIPVKRGDGFGPDDYDESSDLSVPPTPLGLSAVGGYSSINLSWFGNNYKNHAYTEVWRNTVDELGSAVMVGTSIGNLYNDAVGTEKTYYYWVRFVSRANVSGPYNLTSGTPASTAIDVAKSLEVLRQEILNDPLTKFLGERISIVEGQITRTAESLEELNAARRRIELELQTNGTRLLNEAKKRTDDIKDEAAARAAALLAEAIERGAAITNESRIRQEEDESLAQQIVTVTAAVGANAAAIQQEAYTRATADSAEATLRELLAARVGDSESSIYNLQTVTQDQATAISVLQTASGNASSSIVALQETTATQASQITTLGTRVGNAESGITNLQTTTAEQATQISGLSTRVGSAESKITTLETTTANQASQITQLNTKVDANDSAVYATLTNSYYTKVQADSAISTATQDLVSSTQLTNTLGSYATNATLANNYYTKTATDSAISSATQGLVSSTDLNNYVTNATLTNNYYTKTATDSAISSATSTLVSSAQLNTALGSYTTTVALQQNYYTKASAAGLEAQYTVKIDANGHVSGFGLATTAKNGTPESAFIIRADRFAIVNPSSTANSLTTTPSQDATPFMVFSTPTDVTLGGVTKRYPAGVWMNAALIANATIDSAQINTLSAEKITTGTITATIDMQSPVIRSGSIAPGAAGFYLGAYGGSNRFYIGNGSTGTDGRSLEFNGSDATVRGNVYAYGGTIGGNVLSSDHIRSSTYTANSEGWKINSGGSAEFNNVKIRGEINGGAYTGWAWPASGSNGFHLGPNGLLLGNATDNKYFRADSNGNVYAPGFEIVSGNASFSGSLAAASGTFSGTLTANAINAVGTINIAGSAVTVPAVSSSNSNVNVNRSTSPFSSWQEVLTVSADFGNYAPSVLVSGVVNILTIPGVSFTATYLRLRNKTTGAASPWVGVAHQESVVLTNFYLMSSTTGVNTFALEITQEDTGGSYYVVDQRSISVMGAKR